MMRVLDLFSGLGGFSLGLERTGGFRTVAFCEIEPYPRKVLAKHWPGVPIYDDVRKLTADRLVADGISVDVICGGTPCQDISLAGKGAGLAGARSGLWSEYARLVGELRPRYVILENVSALLGRGFGRVLGDLSQIGYSGEWHCIPASALGAPHRRDRLWLVAYPADPGRNPVRLFEQWLSWGWTDGVPDEGQALAGDDGETQPVSDPDSWGLESVGLAQHAEFEGSRGHQPDGLREAGWRDGPMAHANGGGQSRIIGQDEAWEADAACRSGEDVADAGRLDGIRRPGAERSLGEDEGERGEGGRHPQSRRQDVADTQGFGRRPRSGQAGPILDRDLAADGSADVPQPSGEGLAFGQGTPGPRRPCAPASGGGWGTAQSGVRGVVARLPQGLDRGLDVWSAGEWPGVPRVTSGVKNRVDRLKALGNAVVPQIPELLGRAILRMEQ